MRKLLLTLVLSITACQPARPISAPAPAPLAAALDSVFADTALAHAHWGVEVRSPRTGKVLYRRNAERMFVPASNTKIVTGAAALEALGPEYRYRTALEAAGPVERGELRGDLVVRGSGDPTFSTAFHPDVRAVFRAWADSLRARGITRVAGRVVGNDDVFDDIPLGRGWAWDDLEAYYAAEISGLELNQGVIGVRVAPGARPGDPARVTLAPPTAYVPVENRALTSAAGEARVSVSRAPSGPGIVVSGTLPADTAGVEESIAVRDNTLYFATVLRETLREAGIRVDGPAVDADALPGGAPALATTPLFVHASPPLREILPAFLKPSQNQLGEILLKTLGRELRGEGSARAGIAVTDSLVRAWGLEARLLRQADGSGLSRYNLVAPDLLIGILARMAESPHREVWLAALPVGGVDGTLRNRFKGTPLEGRVRAKTGTLSGVRSLSGYLPNAAGETVLFSILVNHHVRSAADADRVIDAALRRIHRSR
jgi:D-alanyl-D-alanine carboxypeptidase/D-alanyl-D-alanine-endopeptidase (penicillin-binding protein 4)